jgi:hypothetical protein
MPDIAMEVPIMVSIDLKEVTKTVHDIIEFLLGTEDKRELGALSGAFPSC